MEEEEIIRYYFHCGFQYTVIRRFLAEYHDIHISRWLVCSITSFQALCVSFVE